MLDIGHWRKEKEREEREDRNKEKENNRDIDTTWKHNKGHNHGKPRQLSQGTNGQAQEGWKGNDTKETEMERKREREKGCIRLSL